MNDAKGKFMLVALAIFIVGAIFFRLTPGTDVNLKRQDVAMDSDIARGGRIRMYILKC